MSEMFEPSPEQFGVFWDFLMQPDVTDVDYNGSALWITDLKKGKYRAKEAEEKVTENFLDAFTHNIANCVDAQFNNANKVLEADTKELRISIIHDSVAATGTSVCIRRSPCLVRNTINGMLNSGFCEEKVLHLLLNCVRAGMNFVFGGEPGAGKTETAKFFMQFIPKESRVITIEDSLEIHYPEINAGADAVELRVKDNFSYTDAIKACLRQNPAYLVLSEARSMEVTSLLEQWSVNDARRMENRIYRYVNLGLLIRKENTQDGEIRRYLDQLCFYAREDHENRIYMLVEDGELVSEEIPKDILLKLELAGIQEPFFCESFYRYRKEGR